VTGVVADPGDLFDELAHPRQGPKVGRKAKSWRTRPQGFIQKLQVLLFQSRLAPSTTRLSQGRAASAPPRRVPAMNAGPADAELAGDLRLLVPTGSEHTGSPLPAGLQPVEVAARTKGLLHAGTVFRHGVPPGPNRYSILRGSIESWHGAPKHRSDCTLGLPSDHENQSARNPGRASRSPHISGGMGGQQGGATGPPLRHPGFKRFQVGAPRAIRTPDPQIRRL
jgi:hypothetical protein